MSSTTREVGNVKHYLEHRKMQKKIFFNGDKCLSEPLQHVRDGGLVSKGKDIYLVK